MTQNLKTQYDAIVVGGGPGGSTAATLLAKAGKSVLLIEKDKFPRYRIGESLVPGIVPVLEELDVLDKIDAHGFTEKFGITLVWGGQQEKWSVDFDEAGGASHGKAYQVVRSEFDYILIQNAREKGVVVLEDTAVTDFLFEGTRCAGVSFRGVDGHTHEAFASVIIDASGQANMLGRRLHDIEVVDDLKNRAVWAYYQGGTVPQGKTAGNIIVENNISDGWLWMIPLHDGTHSIGLVAPQDSFRGRDTGEMFAEKIAESNMISDYLKDATQVTDFRSHKDWSYSCSQLQGEGYYLVGDAAGFVDPLFSTGVFLAMNSASLAVKQILASFAEPEREAEHGAVYEANYRQFLDVVTSFVKFFYDTKKQKENYFDHARDLVDPMDMMTARQDFVYLITGLGGLHQSMGLSPQEAMANLAKRSQSPVETAQAKQPSLEEV
ncbi:MAG: tryptophan 7-halogenase [Paracoccaceae bacterium]